MPKSQSKSGPTAHCWSLRLLIQMAEGGGLSEANSAHTENKGAFGWSCGGPSCGCSGQEARHCGETAVLGGKPAGDAALGSKGTLFNPYPGSGCCWAGSGPFRGLSGMGARAWTMPRPHPGLRMRVARPLWGHQATQTLTQTTPLLFKA